MKYQRLTTSSPWFSSHTPWLCRETSLQTSNDRFCTCVKHLEQTKRANSVTLENKDFCLTPKALCLDNHTTLPWTHQKKISNMSIFFLKTRIWRRGEGDMWLYVLSIFKDFSCNLFQGNARRKFIMLYLFLVLSVILYVCWHNTQNPWPFPCSFCLLKMVYLCGYYLSHSTSGSLFCLLEVSTLLQICTAPGLFLPTEILSWSVREWYTKVVHSEHVKRKPQRSLCWL